MSIWTPELIDEITKLWNEGLTTAEIGKRIGVSKNAVIGKAHRLGLPPRPSPIKRVVRPRATIAPPPKPMPAPVRPTMVAVNGPGCKWPFGHPGEADFHFCGRPALVGKPYCAEHYAVAYIPAKPRSDADAA